jgi:hypothetical protein
MRVFGAGCEKLVLILLMISLWTELGHLTRASITLRKRTRASISVATRIIKLVLNALTRMSNRREPPLAVVIGGSGSGKSSLVRAGVVPWETDRRGV